MMINHAFKRKKNVGIATLHCNAQTTSDDVIKKVSQVCSLYSSPEGRVYRPRDCERLVLYLKDINLPRPDMYDTCQLIAFLQQIITFDGFYDSALEFLRLERIQIVASINAVRFFSRVLSPHSKFSYFYIRQLLWEGILSALGLPQLFELEWSIIRRLLNW